MRASVDIVRVGAGGGMRARVDLVQVSGRSHAGECGPCANSQGRCNAGECGPSPPGVPETCGRVWALFRLGAMWVVTSREGRL